MAEIARQPLVLSLPARQAGPLVLASPHSGRTYPQEFIAQASLPEAVLRWARLRRGAEAYPPMEVTLDDEGLTLRTEASEGGLPWASFAEIQRHSGFWIFRISRSQAVLVPERAFDEGAGGELAAFLRERKLFRG